MRVSLYTNSLSAHQLPLAREIVARIGEGRFRYIYTGVGGQKFQQGENVDGWVKQESALTAEDRLNWLEDVDVMLVGGIRPIELLERRSAKGLKTFYQTERWFKPMHSVPGWVRLLVPRYRKMARRFVNLIRNDPNFHCLPIGVWAERDMLRLCRLMGAGDCRSKMTLWGYFVSPASRAQPDSESGNFPVERSTNLKILWLGRFLRLKRVDTIIKAVADLSRQGFPITLTLVGEGPEEARLKSLVSRTIPRPNNRTISFRPPVPLSQVRDLMRSHGVYVFASNAYEGWGAVVSEALEEGMKVLGTYEAGASATMLPESCLFHAGDWKALAQKLSRDIPFVGIGEWTAAHAAEILVKGAGYAI